MTVAVPPFNPPAIAPISETRPIIAPSPPAGSVAAGGAAITWAFVGVYARIAKARENAMRRIIKNGGYSALHCK